MYQMINEELRIASCKLGDLTMQQINGIVAQFNGDALSTLTGFFNREDNVVVLNEEHADYDFYLKTTERYLNASGEKREYIKGKALSNGTKEFLEMLDKAIIYQKALNVKLITGKMRISEYFDVVPVLNELDRIENNNFHECNLYMYGYIMGKRAERARRKKVTA